MAAGTPPPITQLKNLPPLRGCSARSATHRAQGHQATSVAASAGEAAAADAAYACIRSAHATQWRRQECRSSRFKIKFSGHAKTRELARHVSSDMVSGPRFAKVYHVSNASAPPPDYRHRAKGCLGCWQSVGRGLHDGDLFVRHLSRHVGKQRGGEVSLAGIGQHTEDVGAFRR